MAGLLGASLAQSQTLGLGAETRQAGLLASVPLCRATLGVLSRLLAGRLWRGPEASARDGCSPGNPRLNSVLLLYAFTALGTYHDSS